MSASEQRNGAGGDPLARIGERLVGAAVERRRRRRHARQRLAGALATAVAVVALLVVARPFDGGSAPAPPAGRVELAAPGGRFAVYAGEHGALCANRPNSRDAAGTTSCASPPLVEAELASNGAVLWPQARRVGSDVVVTGIAAADSPKVTVSLGAALTPGSTVRSLDGPTVAVPLPDGSELSVRPFAVTLTERSTSVVHVTTADGGREPAVVQRVWIGAPPESRLLGGRRFGYALEGGGAAARVAELAQARVASVGPGLSQVIGDGDRLTVELPSRTPGPAADARAALAPGVLRFYDWEASVQLPDGRTVAEGLADGAAPRATSISRSAGAADGMRLGVARTLAQLPENLRSPSHGTVMQTGEHGAVVQTLGRDGRASTLPRDDPRARFFVVHGRPALTGAELVDPRAVIGAAGQPEVRFDFTAQGRRAFQRVTRTIAQRGQALMLPGVRAAEVAQHFAIVLDDRLLSVAAVDPVRLPDGIDGRAGALIAGGFTTRSAEQLARLLALGPMPALRELR